MNINTSTHPRNPSVDVKLNAIKRCFENGESIQSVSEDIGYTRASIYQWRKRYLEKGAVALRNDKNIKPNTLIPGETLSGSDLENLQKQMRQMQMEIDILKETIDVLKKDPDFDQTNLKNREKTVIIEVLKIKYSLSELLQRLNLSKSSYYYQVTRLRKDNKYVNLSEHITLLFKENDSRYGYRRIHALLKRENITVSEKIVRRIMKDNHLQVIVRRAKKYNSYKGEITPAVENVIQRDFSADKPNQKWLTDITEFALPFGKVYLSPIVDCFDGMLVSWNISTKPDAELVNTMLDKAVLSLPDFSVYLCLFVSSF